MISGGRKHDFSVRKAAFQETLPNTAGSVRSLRELLARGVCQVRVAHDFDQQRCEISKEKNPIKNIRRSQWQKLHEVRQIVCPIWNVRM